MYADSREQDESHPHFIFHFKLSKTILDFISGLINLNCNFNIIFLASPKIKAIISWGFLSHIHNGVLSKILPTFRNAFQALYKDGYDKTNQLSFYKYSLTSLINKLGDTAVELGSKDVFTRPGTPFLTPIVVLKYSLIS